jgi:hypothetical protein
VADIKRRLSIVAREVCQLNPRDEQTRSERSALMRSFWHSITPEERAAFRLHILGPAHHHWESNLTPEERAAQRAKQSKGHEAEDAVARITRMWAKRSKRKRKAVGAAITAGQLRYWSAHPEMRAVRGAVSKAGKERRALRAAKGKLDV